MNLKLNFKKVVIGQMDDLIGRVTLLLKNEGFGILTRIDLDQKFKEKLGKVIPPVVVLGACNPNMAYEAYLKNTDVTSLLPCNVVLRCLTAGRVSVEIARPSAMIEILGQTQLADLADKADQQLQKVLESL